MAMYLGVNRHLCGVIEIYFIKIDISKLRRQKITCTK